MNNKKQTKKALCMSVLSMVLCVAMLVGMTFAWFTDTASTAVNKIQSGTLKVDIVNTEGESIKGEHMSFVDVNGSENILWEPGVTFRTAGFKVKNLGNLALKYKLQLNGITGNSELLDVITFSVVKKDGDTFVPIDLNDFEGNLTATNQESEVLYIQGHMSEAAGNTYQGKELSGIGITVLTTQYTYENDSKDNTYDADATYPVASYAEMKETFAKGGIISINTPITADALKTAVADQIAVVKPTTLNLDAVYTVPGELEDSANWAAFFVCNDLTINANGNAGINCIDKKDASAKYNGGPYAFNINAEGKTVTVNGGKYYAGCSVFNVERGTLIVNDGFFQVTPDAKTKDYRYTLNCIDANYNNETAKIVVKGGTYVNFDPSNNAAEGEGTNFVADGYKVVSETQTNGDVWYTVVKK